MSKGELSQYRINEKGVMIWSATAIVWEVVGWIVSSGQPTFNIRRLTTTK